MNKLLPDELVDQISAPAAQDFSFACSCCPASPARTVPCDCELAHRRSVAALKSDLNLTARLGKELVEKLRVTESTMATQESDFETQLAALSDANRSLVSENFELSEQIHSSIEMLGASQSKVDELNARLAEAQTRIARLSSYAALVDSLEKQVDSLETTQETLRSELSSTSRDKTNYATRWRTAERSLEEVTHAYHQMSGVLTPEGDQTMVWTSPIERPLLLSHELGMTTTPARVRPRHSTGEFEKAQHKHSRQLFSTPERPQVVPTVSRFAVPLANSTIDISDSSLSEPASETFADTPGPVTAKVLPDSLTAMLDATPIAGVRKALSHESFLGPTLSKPLHLPNELSLASQGVSPEVSSGMVSQVARRDQSSAALNMRNLLKEPAQRPAKAAPRGWLSFRR